ncbi:uncharacterized protein EI90DRAFT_3119820 [Cantharellus anzutake]|uniref:uncharacterized protein n=1 Tax=Cantharellus anzutake TaxID=1750568 RepID=UPI0019060865|nr:uncharacterized protein EI90DRAFT_3119820 [Cantharellus anzutake]KAF8336570.1 hypothetical protein EI90DRAFT_3119820 [Cantharellus anzutake]
MSPTMPLLEVTSGASTESASGSRPNTSTKHQQSLSSMSTGVDYPCLTGGVEISRVGSFWKRTSLSRSLKRRDESSGAANSVTTTPDLTPAPAIATAVARTTTVSIGATVTSHHPNPSLPTVPANSHQPLTHAADSLIMPSATPGPPPIRTPASPIQSNQPSVTPLSPVAPDRTFATIADSTTSAIGGPSDAGVSNGTSVSSSSVRPPAVSRTHSSEGFSSPESSVSWMRMTSRPSLPAAALRTSQEAQQGLSEPPPPDFNRKQMIRIGRPPTDILYVDDDNNRVAEGDHSWFGLPPHPPPRRHHHRPHQRRHHSQRSRLHHHRALSDETSHRGMKWMKGHVSAANSVSLLPPPVSATTATTTATARSTTSTGVRPGSTGTFSSVVDFLAPPSIASRRHVDEHSGGGRSIGVYAKGL